MREIIRLVAFAIITFGITALALLFSNPEFTRDVSRRLGLIDPLEEGATERLAESDRIIRLYRPHLGTWVGLQGFPSQASLRFPLPAIDTVMGGQLQLDLQTHLIDQGDGLVRININGRERDALVLDRGEAIRRLTYDLLPSDLAAGEIMVNLSGDGTTNYGQVCPTNVTNLGAAIEVMATSGVLLELDAPHSDAAEQVVLAPDPLPFDQVGRPAMAIWATQYLTRQGVAAELAPAELARTVLLDDAGNDPIGLSANGRLTAHGTAGIDAIGVLRGMALPSAYDHVWPLPVNALTTDLLAHTFRGSTHWTLDYKLADLPDGRAPGMLRLALRTSQLRDDNDWTLRVLLNGQMIHNSAHAGQAERIAADIALPVADQGLANQLVVSLVDNSPNQGICRAGPEAAAQLLPETAFDPAAEPASDKQVLVQRLAASTEVSLLAPDAVAPGNAMRATGLIEMTLPLDVETSFASGGDVTIQLVDTGSNTSAFPSEARAAFLVTPSRQGEQDGISVTSLDLTTQPASLPAGAGSGLLISW